MSKSIMELIPIVIDRVKERIAIEVEEAQGLSKAQQEKLNNMIEAEVVRQVKAKLS